MTTKTAQAVHLVWTIVLFWTLAQFHLPWWLYLITGIWGLFTGAWAFSAGWDARGK